MTLAQGDPRLLETDLAERLLTSTIPARYAYMALDGTPRIVSSSGYLAQIDQPGTRMARIAVRPAWVALMDFQTRMPSALGGVQ
jgi:hypothetical protein